MFWRRRRRSSRLGVLLLLLLVWGFWGRGLAVAAGFWQWLPGGALADLNAASSLQAFICQIAHCWVLGIFGYNSILDGIYEISRLPFNMGGSRLLTTLLCPKCSRHAASTTTTTTTSST